MLDLIFDVVFVWQGIQGGLMPWSGQAKRPLEHLLQWNLLLMVQKQGLWIAMDLFLSLRYVLSVEIFWVCDSVTLLISLLVTFFNVILYNRYMKLGTWFLWINQKLHFRCSKAGWEGIWSNKRRLEIINVPHNFYRDKLRNANNTLSNTLIHTLSIIVSRIIL